MLPPVAIRHRYPYALSTPTASHAAVFIRKGWTNTQNWVSNSAIASFDRTSNTSRHLGVLQRPPELKDPLRAIGRPVREPAEQYRTPIDLQDRSAFCRACDVV